MDSKNNVIYVPITILMVLAGISCSGQNRSPSPEADLGPIAEYIDDSIDDIKIESQTLHREWGNIFGHQLGSIYIQNNFSILGNEKSGAAFRPPNVVGTYVKNPSEKSSEIGTGNVSFDGFLLSIIRSKFKADAKLATFYIISAGLAHDVQNQLFKEWDLERYRTDESALLREYQSDYLVGVSWKHLKDLKITRARLTDALTHVAAAMKERAGKRDLNQVAQCTFGYGTIDERVNWILKGYESGKVHKYDNYFLKVKAGS